MVTCGLSSPHRFWRLFKYISGNNEQEQKVEMTAPVTVRVTPSQGPFCEDNFTISFFVPFAVQVGCVVLLLRGCWQGVTVAWGIV